VRVVLRNLPGWAREVVSPWVCASEPNLVASLQMKQNRGRGEEARLRAGLLAGIRQSLRERERRWRVHRGRHRTGSQG
jgi:hypothetical protein